MKQACGYYNELGYTVTIDGEEVYQAGNSPYDSQGYVSAAAGVGLAQMERYCESTTKEIANELGAEYVGIEFEEWGREDIGMKTQVTITMPVNMKRELPREWQKLALRYKGTARGVALITYPNGQDLVPFGSSYREHPQCTMTFTSLQDEALQGGATRFDYIQF